MSKRDSKRSKADTLLEEGTLNPMPEKVRDPKFRGSEFFDPRDAVQVKYEMLRRVSIDNVSVTDVSDEYGVSRPTYYQAKANFDAAGIAGLVPKKPGPRRPHKVHGEVLALLQADSAAVWSVPPQWTDLVGLDPEVVMGHGRALMRAVDLMELAGLVKRLSDRPA